MKFTPFGTSDTSQRKSSKMEETMRLDENNNFFAWLQDSVHIEIIEINSLGWDNGYALKMQIFTNLFFMLLSYIDQRSTSDHWTSVKNVHLQKPSAIIVSKIGDTNFFWI